METIKLSDILLMYIEFLADPSNEETEKKIQETLSKLVIRQYLPLEEKSKIMLSIIGCAQVADDTDGIKISMNIEIGKIITGLIRGYCVNIENDLDISSLQLSVFDLLYDTGFTDYILDHGARRDFERLDKMIDNALNMNNLVTLVNAFENFDPDNIEDMFKNIDYLKNELTPEKIEFLKNIMKTGTPEFDKITSVLNEQVLRETLGSEKIDQYKTTTFGLATEVENNAAMKSAKAEEKKEA